MSQSLPTNSSTRQLRTVENRSWFLTHQHPAPDSRHALAEALRAVASAAQALVALAEALEQGQAPQPPPAYLVGPEALATLNTLAPAASANGHREVGP